MKKHSPIAAAIIDLHERGFTEDFKFQGKDILWIQHKLSFHPNDLFISECHRCYENRGKRILLYGVVSNVYNVKGIVMSYQKLFSVNIQATRETV